MDYAIPWESPGFSAGCGGPTAFDHSLVWSFSSGNFHLGMTHGQGVALPFIHPHLEALDVSWRDSQPGDSQSRSWGRDFWDAAAHFGGLGGFSLHPTLPFSLDTQHPGNAPGDPPEPG